MDKRAVLVYVDEVVRESKVREFEMLARAGGYEPLEVLIQKRRQDQRFYVGRGKLEELKEVVRRLGAGVVITYHELKPTQYVNLERSLGVRVMDRIQLILEIFDRRAGSREAKLQIELARLRHEIPRIREYIRLAKLGEQIGFLGAGEYAVEAYYRYVLNRVSVIKRELEEIRGRKERLVLKRKDAGLPEVVITGYTMAGKTTLFNRLTRDEKYRDGMPFATLSTYSHVVNICGAKVIITDTIGFIDDLPPLLIEAFYATITEIAHADLLLLVLDTSDEIEEFERKLRSSLKGIARPEQDRHCARPRR